MNNHFYKMLCSIFLVIFLFNTTDAWCQKEVTELRFVGYQNQYPVFILKKGNGGEAEMMENAEAVEEVSEVMEEAEAFSEVSSSSVSLLRLSSTGKTEQLPTIEGIDDVLCYADGKLVGISQYGVEVVVDGTFIDLQFQEEYFDDSDFRSKLLEMAERFNVTNITFSPDSEQLHYPVYSRLKIRSYNFAKASFSEIDLSKINDYGGSILMPVETTDYVYFLAISRGSYELFQMNKNTGEIKKAPFMLGKRGYSSMKSHPTRDQVLFIYDNVPLAYSFGLNKFQKLEISKTSVARKDQIASDFDKIYYARDQKEWMYATLDNEQLVAKPLEISNEDVSFNLEWSEIEELLEQERMKNLSPEEELTMNLKRLAQLPRPLSNDMKAEINNMLLQFDEKYRAQASEAKVKKALVTSRIIRLDTSLVTNDVVASSKEHLIDLVKREQLDYNPMLGLQLIGRVATVQPPVHSARVAVLEALVNDHLEENEISSAEALDASGLGLLLLALKANGQYEEAIRYTQQILGYIERNSMAYGKLEAYESLIYLQVSAGQYQNALESINTYQAELNPNSGNYPEKHIEAEIKKAHAYAGMKNFDRAFEILEAQSQRIKESEEEIFGSETKLWLGFSLRYAHTEIHFKQDSRQKGKQLTNLLTYTSNNAASFQYQQMYAETVKLLYEIGEVDRAKELPIP
ncbi:hypothetical protein [Tunicatimonas pelagia]|uniref:hypothetical protein n=1 Tax=Tunicatimonas pelagia TaxID=931531 RepID=UPI002666D6CF|nr:hypothetical protein [Tunicatimonas pelagia]WKN44752.1 hypothetical protein P0M28_07215 [Tunicatimonas pelagia]